MKRRRFTKAIVGTGMIAIAGCTGIGGDGDSDSGDGDSSGIQQDQTSCHKEERERTRTSYDDVRNMDAGDVITWNYDLKEGEQIQVKAVMIEGARPALQLKDPDGNAVIETDPTANIERRFTAAESGTHYVTLENEALVTSGQWDITIEITEKYEEEVCS